MGRQPDEQAQGTLGRDVSVKARAFPRTAIVPKGNCRAHTVHGKFQLGGSLHWTEISI